MWAAWLHGLIGITAAVVVVLLLLWAFSDLSDDEPATPSFRTRPMKDFLSRHWKLATLFAAGLLAWFGVSWLSGDVIALAIGPDQIAKAVLVLVLVPICIWIARKVVKWRFTTLWEFTAGEVSKFGVMWRKLTASEDPYIQLGLVALAIVVHLGVFIGVAILMPK